MLAVHEAAMRNDTVCSANDIGHNGHMALEHSRFLQGIESEGGRLGALPVDALNAPVPMLDGWTGERVVRHVGKVHRWVTGLLNAPADTDPNALAAAAPSLPKGPACLEAYRDALCEMLDAFAVRDPNQPVASFIGASDVAFWARRQAHELGVHRVDATDALHALRGLASEALDPALAADGIDEWLTVFVETRHDQRGGVVPDSLYNSTFVFEPLATSGDDVLARLVLHYDEIGRPTVGTARDEFDVSEQIDRAEVPDAITFRSPAETLFLTVWRRRPLESATILGDDKMAELLIDTMRF